MDSLDTQHRKNIVIVDDDADTRLMLATTLYAQGYRPLSFSSPQQLLSNIENISAELILLDMLMPEMNGISLMKLLRQNAKFANTPFIMITAIDSENALLNGYIEGADYYIPKPFTPRQLQYGMKLVLSGARDEDGALPH